MGVGCWVLLLVGSVSAQTAVNQETMMVAGRLYENGRFLEAAQLYQQVVDGGVVDSGLFYNAGTAYYRAGELGWAMLHLERAARLAPRDAAIAANLALARQQAGGPQPPLLDLVLADGRAWLSLNETAVLALLAWVAAWGCWWAYRRWRLPFLRGIIWATAVVCLLALLLLGGRLWVERERPLAIVVAAQVSAVSNPTQPENDLFTLGGGTAVNITIERPDWLYVTQPGSDREGWVPARAVEQVGLP
ncbi:MAG: hypothetical protein R3C62_01480 [Chloroflexota bacterium]